MSLYLDEKYLSLVSYRLRNFKRKSGSVHQFSCPICGDSQRDKRKARGYAFESDGVLHVYCQKCAASTNVRGLLKLIDPDLYREYCSEAFVESGYAFKPRRKAVQTDFNVLATPIPASTENPLSGLLKPSKLPSDHIARQLCDRRQIPYDRVLHCDDFNSWANTLISGKFSEDKVEPRLVIPFWRDGKLHGFQGRSYDPKSKVKYLTVSLDTEIPILYRIDEVHKTVPIMAFEGPIDAMFLPNAIATAGGSIPSALNRSGLPKDRFVVCYDNEPRSKATVKKMREAVKAGYDVCIWPKYLKEKDANDMILGGFTPEQIVSMVRQGTKHGMLAELEITNWKKCEEKQS